MNNFPEGTLESHRLFHLDNSIQGDKSLDYPSFQNNSGLQGKYHTLSGWRMRHRCPVRMEWGMQFQQDNKSQVDKHFLLFHQLE